ncbi:MAG: ATP-binding protein [Desulfobulbaceae bacterium]|jgi:signal transduction histidine kinase|nr:ATP-binding protein [Desulfobulbaceae bacterium]
MRFSTKIGLSGTMAAVIIGPLLGAAVFFNARSLLLERIVYEQVQIASGVMAEIDNALFKAAGQMNVMAADNFLRDYLDSPAEHKGQADTVADELEERAELTGPWCNAIIVLDPSGRKVFIASKEQDNSSALAASPMTRIAFESALKGKTYRSDRIICRRTGQPVVIFAVPVFSRVNTDKVVGVVASRYVWAPIQNILDNVDATAKVHLLNRKGEVIGTRSSDHFDIKPLPPPSTNPAWKDLPDGGGYAVLARSSHGGGDSLTVGSPPGSAGWTLMMEKPFKVMFAPITLLARNTGMLVFGVLLVTGVLLATIVRLFIRPLAELIEGVRQVDQGRFDQKVTVRSKDEFGELADSFNAMVEKLQTTQDELVRKEKMAMLGQVAGSLGNELRNPLGVMSNAVYFLQTVLEDGDDSAKEYLGIILAEITRSENIVDELLAAVLTRTPDVATHGVAELVGQILRQCIVPEGVTVTLDIPATIPPLRVDALQMQQVLRNLISNSVEAMVEGGTLAINAVENRQKGTVRLSVHDSGSGMTPEVMARLFQPLFTTKSRGIGLGLVVAKNLTEANGGHIEVQSEVGLGTTFSIILPGDYQEENHHG